MRCNLSLLAKLPLSVLQSIGAAIGELAFWLAPSYRRRIRENLLQANLCEPSILKEVSKNAGRQSLESIWVWYRPVATVLAKVKVTARAQTLIENAMKSQQAVVFMTPHVGCFEVLPVWLAGTFYKDLQRNITILYRPPKNAWLRSVVGKARQAEGIEAVPTTLSGVKHIIRNMRKGHTFGALPDQVPSGGGEGVWAPFFNKQALTMTLAIRVAKQFNAIRIFAWTTRTEEGWVLDAKEWDDPLTEDMRHNAALMNHQIEDIIRSCPTQYAWSYNRYKNPGVPLPPESENETSK